MISADVRFYEHDVINRMFNENEKYNGPIIKYYVGRIIVEDNVCIGARSIILYNVTIGHDSVVAAGSVVSKNIPAYSIVAGNPAKIIGSTKELLRKRLEYSGNNCPDNYNYEDFFK